MEVKPALALPTGLEVTALEVSEHVLTLTVVSTQVHPACPLCGVPAVRVHSRYTRQVADLPCGGRQVRLR
jgi:transposase